MYKFNIPSPSRTEGGIVTVSMTADHLDQSGIPLDVKDGKVAISPPEHHCMIYGVSGKGKSRRIIYPSVLMSARAGHSIICIDPKGEIYRNTGVAVRSAGLDVKVINLREPLRGNRWSPLALIEREWKNGNRNRAQIMLRDVAKLICDTIASTRDGFWRHAAEDMLIGFATLLLENEYPLTFDNIHSVANDYASDPHRFTLGQEIAANCNEARRRLATITNLDAETTLTCIVSEFDAAVSAYTDTPEIRDLLSASDIDLVEIGKRPTAVFLITPDESNALNGIAGMLVEQSYSELVRYADSLETNRLPLHVDYIIDEFAGVPGSDWPSKLTAARSRGIRFVLALQSLPQLAQRYGSDAAKVITSNCRTMVYLGGRDMDLMREINAYQPDETAGLLGLATLAPGHVVILGDSGIPRTGRLPDWEAWGVKEKASLAAQKRTIQESGHLTVREVLGIKIVDADADDKTDECPF